MATKNDPGTEIERMISEDQLRGITSFEDALALVSDVYGGLVDASEEIGTGFQILKDKSKLEDVPFIILNFSEVKGDFGASFSTLRLVTERGERWVIVDGSTGIHEQLTSYQKRTGRNGGLLARGGLRASHYEYEDDKGNLIPATTYYLNV